MKVAVLATLATVALAVGSSLARDAIEKKTGVHIPSKYDFPAMM
jgi:hypothetical protein